jgi:predicted dehydrogenase/nucleoside-diphosphate-sugar epimerase
MAEHQVALVGAGYISDVHAEVLRALRPVRLQAVVDPHEGRARALARRFGIPHVFADVGSLVRDGGCDVAHVLVPPAAHRAAAEPLLRAGLHVLVEKPLAPGPEDCTALRQAAAARGVRLGVNQNQVHHPAFAKLRSRLVELGPLQHVTATVNLPLRQLASRSFGHWMFQEPQNLLLEQAVHPLSQIVSLIGEVREIAVLTDPPRSLPRGHHFYDTWLISLRGARADGQLLFSVGQDFPDWTVRVIGTDGVGCADIVANRTTVTGRSRWLEAGNDLVTGLSAGLALQRQSVANLVGYASSRCGLRRRSDPFFVGMKASIEAFYEALRTGDPAPQDELGASLVELCDRIARAAGIAAGAVLPEAVPATAGRPAECDVAVLGGTGFIGTHVVRRMVAERRRVSVLARNTAGLPQLFSDPAVRLVSGDVCDRASVARAIGTARTVINLAVGAAGTAPEEIVHGIREAARIVGETCVEQGVVRLVHVSTIAALYLGNDRDIVTGGTPVDPRAAARAAYSRGKAEAEQVLLGLHRTVGLPLCILRPGLVIGEGSSPFHGGVGFYNNDQHCLGWSHGDTQLPFVLVEDVADAIVSAMEAPGVVGRSYNLVGDCRLTAREYIAELGGALGRPLRFHPQTAAKLALIEAAKWLIKLSSGSRSAARPTYRDLRSRGLRASFDCSDAKQALGWSPVADRATFVRLGIRHVAPGA